MSANSWSGKENQGVPSKLKCSADGKWEVRVMFSNNMLQKYKFGRGPITCRKHTPGPVVELVCVSCHRVKPANDFSKAARKINGSRRCRDCVDWTEGDTAGYNPLPAPNDLRSVEERALYNRPREVLDLCDLYEEEQEDEYVADVAGPAVATHQDSSGGRPKRPAADNSTSLTAYSLERFNASNPAHGRGGQSLNTASGPADMAPADTDSSGTATTACPRKHVHFNAYGPEGQVQQRVKSVPASSERTASTVPSRAPGHNTWAKVRNRKIAMYAPSYIQYENPEDVGECYDSDGSMDLC